MKTKIYLTYGYERSFHYHFTSTSRLQAQDGFVADMLRPAFEMLTEDKGRAIGRQTQSALTPHLTSSIVLDQVLCLERASKV